MSTWVDPRHASLGQHTSNLLLDVASGGLYDLTHEGWAPQRRMRRLFWSPTRSQVLVWFGDGPPPPHHPRLAGHQARGLHTSRDSSLLATGTPCGSGTGRRG